MLWNSISRQVLAGRDAWDAVENANYMYMFCQHSKLQVCDH